MWTCKKPVIRMIMMGFVTLGLMGCGDSPVEDVTTPGDCRPVDHPWDPAKEPVRLPCASTQEPCDGVDNDADGITDPHCGTMDCTTDADCSSGGLVPDVDCNPHADDGPKCSQIDGVDPKGKPKGCWGMLCPPGLKCVEGDCYVPGALGPGEPCSTGEDCPIHAGCIPMEEAQFDTAVCTYFCHDIPCPDGFHCSQGDNAEGKESNVCFPEGNFPDCVPNCDGKLCGDNGCGQPCPDRCPGICLEETGECKTD
jgi:hypothetical protein